jgi:hypothetical protein
MVLVCGIFMTVYMAVRVRKSRRTMKDNLSRKISAGVSLVAADLVNMGKGLDLNRFSVNRCLNQLLCEEDDSQRFIELRRLISEMEKEDPFDELPDEVKPSLVRLSEISDASPLKSDHLLLIPVQKTLAAYVELKAEIGKGKTFARIMNALAIAGFIIGAWGFYLTLKSPDAKDIDTIDRRAVAAGAKTPPTPLATGGPGADIR